MTIQQKLAEKLYELLPHKKELEFGEEDKCFCKSKTPNDV